MANLCRGYIRPGDEFQSDPKGVRRDNTRIGPVLDVLVTAHFGRYGSEVNIDALARDGSTSWVVIICNGALDGMQEPMYVDSVTFGTGKPVACMQRRAKSSSLFSGKNQHILIEQRNWEHIPGVDRVLSHCLPISRRMIFLLRHFPKLRDRVGEVHREELTKHFEGLATLNKCDSCPMCLFADCFFDHAVRF